MRIQRPSTRSWLTTLNDCEPPQTCITASVLPWVGRTAPRARGIQSICALNTADSAPCRSGEHHTWPSDHCIRARNSCTLGCSTGASSGSGKPDGSKIRVSAPKCSSRRAASSTSRRLKERSRVDPYSSRMRGLWLLEPATAGVLSNSERSRLGSCSVIFPPVQSVPMRSSSCLSSSRPRVSKGSARKALQRCSIRASVARKAASTVASSPTTSEGSSSPQ